MIAIALSILLVTIVLGVIYWAIHKVWGAFGLPALGLVLVDVLLVLLWVFWLVRLFQLERTVGL